MKLQDISHEALRIKKLYAKYEKKKFGRKWKKEEMFTGLVSDIGDLSRLILAKEGMMNIDHLKERMEHEISECLWGILVLANEYDIDVEDAFTRNMKALEKRIKNDA